MRGRRHASALLLHTLNAKYNTCQFLKVHYIHQLALAMPWGRQLRRDEVRPGCVDPTHT
ncbi:hypothetical protein BAE44_0006564 [Dichanthelium oligosanthes]|uniref:Uncharacterized protein n=1 Tax=Dichanthelium oligosanthes TaxID=888268 RepID=A0A1E5W4S5_9POAL|nr:hypothetical protein BAE44_0006564 [Dichanthelium oligosanthes]